MIKVVKCLVVAMIGLVLLETCVNHDLGDGQVIDETTDERLFAEANDGGFTYYRNGNFIPAASQSPHGTFKLKFNAVAEAALGADGELPENRQFPNGSILVKEVYQNSILTVLAVVKRVPSNIHAREDWIWAEYYVDGRKAASIEDNGKYCVSCHNQTPNRDLIRTFDLH